MTTATSAEASPESGGQRIMDEAAELFLHQGYSATSLRLIAETVGMKAGSLYYHFASKEELLAEILRRGIEVMEGAFDEAEQASAGTSPAAKVEVHVRAHLAALFENGPYTATHVTTFRTAPDAVRSEIVPLRDAYEARWTALLKALVEDGALAADTDISVARLTLFGAMNASVEWFDPERGSLDTFAARITRQFWNGIGAARMKATAR